ncbi:MAG: AMP-binding protein [Actinomycetes bacterium]
MQRLVAIDLPGGPAFTTAVRRAWDEGDAVLPVDPRLPPIARDALLRTMRPVALTDHTGEHLLDGGLPVEPGDALVMPTSGSTGQPKGVVLTHEALTASARSTSRRLGVTTEDHWLACLPLAHIGGFSVLTKAWDAGTRLTVLPGFDAAAVTAAARDGATLVSLVATALRRIDPSLFRLIVLGGSRPPADRPANTVTTYGMTETGSGVVYDGVPLDDVEVQVAADGEILVRGPMLLRCYRDGSTPVDDQGCLHTGDLGHWRPDGRLHVEGRRGDLIVTGGEKVWPEVVEAELRRHPAVTDVAVAGVDDPEWGQRVVAWVVAADPATSPTLDELRRLVTERHPPYVAPRALVRVAAIPRTALGKVVRAALAADHPPSTDSGRPSD